MQDIELSINQLRQAVSEKQPLHPVFDGIFLDKRPAKFSRHEEYTPVLLDGSTILGSSNQISLAELDEEITRLGLLQNGSKTDTLFYLAQKYGWRIGTPGSGDLQDVAFCDAQRVSLATQNLGSSYLLVKGDLSGIQTYIYGDLQPKTAGGLTDVSKRLRGRSVLVTLLTDFLATILLKELELPLWHLLFAGGGHFNLLLPKDKEEDLKVLADCLDVEMRKCFGDKLNLILAWIDCDASIQHKAGEYFQKVNIEKERKKYRQHHHNLQHHFFPKEGVNDQTEKIDNIGLGTYFPKRNLLLEVASKDGISSKQAAKEIIGFNMPRHFHQLFIVGGEGKKEAINNAKILLGNADEPFHAAQLFSINRTDFIPSDREWDFSKYGNVSFGFRFLGRYVPLHEEEKRPKTFEEIAIPNTQTTTSALERKGFVRLGALRLDVDDLGAIFSHGLGENASLGQIVCLSREMHYFFTAHFDYLASKPEYDVYVIYSGGDDAFVVGRWDKIIAFIGQLQKDFKAFVRNKDVHFSAGIFIGDPRYPVGRFYRDAGRLQTKAKESGKNKIDVFDQTLSWSEFDGKITLGIGFAEILKQASGGGDKKFTLAFANRILYLVKSSFHERGGLNEDNEKVRRGFIDVTRFSRNIASIRYLFARHGFSEEKLSEIKGEIEKQLTVDFIKSFDRDVIGKPDKASRLRNYLVAFNYALYSIRSQKNK